MEFTGSFNDGKSIELLNFEVKESLNGDHKLTP